jgi:hypothetical protein
LSLDGDGAGAAIGHATGARHSMDDPALTLTAQGERRI